MAKQKFPIVKTQVKLGTEISTQAQTEIQKIMDNLATATTKPNKEKEIEIIHKACQEGAIRKIKPTVVDIYILKMKMKFISLI